MGAELQRAAMMCTRKGPPERHAVREQGGETRSRRSHRAPTQQQQQQQQCMTDVHRAAEPALNLLFLIKNPGPARFMASVL